MNIQADVAIKEWTVFASSYFMVEIIFLTNQMNKNVSSEIIYYHLEIGFPFISGRFWPTPMPTLTPVWQLVYVAHHVLVLICNNSKCFFVAYNAMKQIV